MSKFHHEQSFRGKAAMAQLSGFPLQICGAGAIGSNLAVNLARAGFGNISIIDRDRVEEKNAGTQVYSLDDVGGRKSEILANLIYRELGLEVDAVVADLNAKNAARLLRSSALILDCFDNTSARQLVFDFCRERSVNCLHAGINESYAEVRWNEGYLVPQDAGLDTCDYPLARNLILLVVAVTSEAVVNFILKGEKRNYSITLADLQINHELDC